MEFFVNATTACAILRRQPRMYSLTLFSSAFVSFIICVVQFIEIAKEDLKVIQYDGE